MAILSGETIEHRVLQSAITGSHSGGHMTRSQNLCSYHSNSETSKRTRLSKRRLFIMTQV